MAGNHVEVDHVLSKMKNLEELIKSGMEITQECALDCEENDEGCPDVRDLKEVMLAYANMIRDINQWGKVAKKTVAEFHKNYDASGDTKVNIEELFNENLAQQQSKNTVEELENSKALREFTEGIWNVHHSDEQFEAEDATPEDEEIQIEKITGDKLLCPFSKTEMKQPVKNKQCGHSYDKAAIEGHIRRMGQRAKCPIVGCPQIVKIQDLETDKVLARELKKRYK